jgi:hypothetical protein
MTAALVCHRFSAFHDGVELTIWDDPAQARTAMRELCIGSPPCAGLHTIVWRDVNGRYRSESHGLQPYKPTKPKDKTGDRANQGRERCN